jgi:hypothetical protein
MAWAVAHDWCLNMGLKMPLLKKVNHLDEVANALKRLGFGITGLRKETNNEVVLYVSPGEKNYWLAASDIGQLAPGKFKWTDETPVEKSLWDTSRPNEYRFQSQTCVYLCTSAGRLCDTECTSTSNFMLCEIPEAHSACL